MVPQILSPTDSSHITLSIIVPTFNAGLRLDALCQALFRELETMKVGYEVLLVDDASSDHTWDEVTRLCDRYASFRGIRLAVNSGQHLATLIGLRSARGKVRVTMDDDLRHSPSSIPALVESCTGCGGEYEVVNAQLSSSGMPLGRRVASWLIRSLFARVLNVTGATSYSSFRAIDGRVVERLDGYCGPNMTIDVLLHWVSGRIGFVEVTTGCHQTSRYSYRDLVRFALTTSLGYSKRPLYLTVVMGSAVTVLAMLLASAVVLTGLIGGNPPPGFLTTIVVVMLIGGAQMLMIGTLSVYFATIYDRILGRNFTPIAEYT